MTASNSQPASEGVYPPSQFQSNATPSKAEQNGHEPDSDDEDDILNFSDEDAQSLMNLSISRAASRLTSPKTPATEKAAVMEHLGREYFDSDEDATPIAATPQEQTDPTNAQHREIDVTSTEQGLKSASIVLPHPKAQDAGLPSPWQATPQRMIIQRPEPSRSALRDAFSTNRPRSLSGSAEALRKLLPSLPSISIPKAGNFMSSLPSPTFFSSFGSNQAPKSKASSPKKDAKATPPTPASPIALPTPMLESTSSSPPNLSTPLVGLEGGSNSTSEKSHSRVLKRSNSEDSLLYYSLSRASSLGDDTRFENQHEMINSRLKAIKDSYKDRSSFRLPSLPSMSNVPRPNIDLNNFSFNLGTASPTKSKPNGEAGEGRQSEILSKAVNGSPTVAMPPETPVPKPLGGVDPRRATSSGPNFTALDLVLPDLTGDIVIMGGYRGSILRSRETHKQLWLPLKVGLNLRKVNMEVGLEPEDEERMEETMYPSGMIQNIGPVDLSKRLFKRLRESENARNGSLRIWDYGYDWRLSPHLLSRKLIQFLEQLPSNRPDSKEPHGALVIAHSLGGLITRHAVNKRPELFSGVIFAGVPKSCVNILGPLRNGDEILFSSRVLTAQVNFSLRTSFVLLPLNGFCFVDKNTKESYPVDFFNVDDWIKYRWSPCINPPLPPKSQPPPGTLANILKSVDLPNLQLPMRRPSTTAPKRQSERQPISTGTEQSPPSLVSQVTETVGRMEGTNRALAPQMSSHQNPVQRGENINSSISTAVTIPRDKAIAYLRRTLAETKQFKQELVHNPAHTAQNRYPPFAILYGKSVPTVIAAKVDGRDGIACADAYDDLAFASGDGVTLAKEAMLPEGYHVVKGGRVSTDRGHVTLLGDLNAVGKALEAVTKGRAKGIGMGVGIEGEREEVVMGA